MRHSPASHSLAAPSPPVLLGTNSTVWYVTGMAMDATYFYLASNGVSGEGVYRVTRANVTAAAVKLATVAPESPSVSITSSMTRLSSS